MKQLLIALKSARKIEILVIVVLMSALLLMWLSEGSPADSSTQEEMRMERILSHIEGVGSASVMLARDEKGLLTGAVVAADGAQDLRVRLELQRAVRALTGLETDRIEVLKSER